MFIIQKIVKANQKAGLCSILQNILFQFRCKALCGLKCRDVVLGNRDGRVLRDVAGNLLGALWECLVGAYALGESVPILGNPPHTQQGVYAAAHALRHILPQGMRSAASRFPAPSNRVCCMFFITFVRI